MTKKKKKRKKKDGQEEGEGEEEGEKARLLGVGGILHKCKAGYGFPLLSHCSHFPLISRQSRPQSQKMRQASQGPCQ